MARRCQPCRREAKVPRVQAVSVSSRHSGALSGRSGSLPRLSIGTSAQCLLYPTQYMHRPSAWPKWSSAETKWTRHGQASSAITTCLARSLIELVRPTPRIMRPPLALSTTIREHVVVLWERQEAGQFSECLHADPLPSWPVSQLATNEDANS